MSEAEGVYAGGDGAGCGVGDGLGRVCPCLTNCLYLLPLIAEGQFIFWVGGWLWLSLLLTRAVAHSPPQNESYI